MNNPYYLKDTQGDYYNKYPEFQAWEEGRRACIQEVVKWLMKRDCPYTVFKGEVHVFKVTDEEWQFKLKKWLIT